MSDRSTRTDSFATFGYGVDNPNPQTSLLLLRSGQLDDNAFFNHTDYLAQRLERWYDPGRPCPQDDFSVCRTPGGLAWLAEWGALRHSANVAFLALAYNKLRPSLREYSPGGGDAKDAT